MSYILLGVLALAALYFLYAYNTLVSLRQRARQAFADIDVQLLQRRDLVPNLVETVKSYAAHERETLEAVIAARNAANSAQGTPALATAEAGLGAALGRIMALSESYPDLKANANFMALQQQLGDLEDKIAAARRFLNNSVAEYNAAREAMPAALIANAAGFAPLEFFEMQADARKAAEAPPAVKF